MSEHMTPAPWRIDRDNSVGIEVVGDNGDLVHIENYDGIPQERGAGFAEQIIATARTNTRLIAAAPAMLTALIEIEKRMTIAVQRNQRRIYTETLEIAQSAIAKAEGDVPAHTPHMREEH